MLLKTRIEDMTIDCSPAASQKLCYFNFKIFSSESISYEDVNLSSVVGTCHPKYGNKTWFDLKPVPGSLRGDFINNISVSKQLMRGAIENVRQLEKNPDYYLSSVQKEEWSFYKVGNNYYIKEGNNRTVVARFFFLLNDLDPVIKNVRVHSVKLKILDRILLFIKT
ncbi:hypothetical protein PVK64_19715 [Aliivibrio sp. S4TY2]|uniref:hypothetical protein n=1 Tax=unclassified Aliivibrio TaxID=2645654 RepID=UPI0023793AE1|nr:MULTISPECIES: hypothetical protein [unclassified Aliivibrio]MDD9158396.1 hypothetical protein [Aliivibrio sp. S4TY2]MDD9162396.1 hypothetical protein [Aliivibrio sp. S4TY1]MDD9166403.1 hypothetical protein [Aliivibrio sp. S4MY2]MDD9170401.1 hypothetical protein [Aliivibrio sp. S4MY4]MDD9187489.1 hypothetical protein [Aliivibrio sp. S4MY3]